MRFAKSGKEPDKTKIVYNTNITIEDIPLEAYDYVVNGRPAKDSDIVNAPNQWNAAQTPKYIAVLIQSVVTVSVNIMRIVKSLPKWEE